jgi:ubiquinone/menaquinone biosynthesis C-methylase UbiE
VTPTIRKWLFETLYRNRYLYRFASTVPFAGQWRVWQRLVLPRVRGMDVLELGCGLGDLQVDLRKASYQSRAIELSPQMVAAARDALRRHKLGDPANIIQGSAQSLPFGDATFDTVVSTFPSEYIYDPDTIAEVERVLRPGGRMIVVEGANLLPVGFIQPLLVLIQMLVYGPAALLGRRKQSQIEEADAPSKQTKHEDGTVTEVVSNAWFGRHIPLERFGLQRRSEVVRSRRWEVYITIGEKTPWPADPKES